MVIINLKGGLGNQMFQYAMGRRYAHVSNQTMKLDLGFLSRTKYQSNVTARNYELSIFNIQESFANDHEVRKYKNMRTRIFSKAFPNNRKNLYVKEKYFHFDPFILSLKGGRYFDGHWMSEKYFYDIESIIRKEFTFKRDVFDKAKYLHDQISNSNSICIQVRRGDYITNPDIAKIHQTTSLNYFERGADLLKTKVEKPSFFVFSDDIKWCQKNLSGLANARFIEKELEGEGASNSDYLQLMMSCKHFIISNSTFAWWAAWLSTNSDKIVVAPMHWFNDKSVLTQDIYPPDWIKI